MDTALYTLLGALGGILITQGANYFLEDKKSKNQMSLKAMELEHQKHHDLLKERRLSYSNYLKSIDDYCTQEERDISIVLGYLYAALIVASEETSEKINSTFSQIKEIPLIDSKDFDHKKYLSTKNELLALMRNELQG